MTDSREGFPLPPAMIKRAREFSGEPAQVRPAATVALIRPTAGAPTAGASTAGALTGGEPAGGGLAGGELTGGGPAGGELAGGWPAFEVYVLQRASTMAFGGVYAFPGGGVDPGDRPATVRDDWGPRLGLDDDKARAVVGAAVRELFEEAGVLLAAGPDGVTVPDVGGDDWEADRQAVQRRELSMTDLLARRGLTLRDDLLAPWSRWITPEFEPRRYDTWFFVAEMPAGQVARDVSGEADATDWIGPAAANGLVMLPPTRVTLNQLCAYSNCSEVLKASAQRNAAVPVRPRVELTDDGGAVLKIKEPC